MVIYTIGSKIHFDERLLILLKENQNEKVQKLLEDYRPISPILSISRAKDTYQSTLLHYAAECGNHFVVQYLIDRGSDVDDQEMYRRTPLMLAAVSNREAVVEILLKANANIHLKDFQGKSALRMILERKTMIDVLFRNMTVENMLQGVAPVRLYLSFIEVDFTLYQAVTRQDVKLVKLFLSHNCPVNDKDPTSGETALHAAVKNKNLEIVKMLVEHGANVDALDSVEATPIHYLYDTGNNDVKNFEMLKILLSRAISLTASTAHVEHKLGQLQIYPVLVYGCRKAVELVLKSVDDLNVCDKLGNTITHYVARNKNPNVIETLRGRDFNVNKRNLDGYTPLHDAAFELLSNTVQFLLENGADVDARGHSYNIPLQRLFERMKIAPVRKKEAKNCIKLLLAYGSDPQDYDVLENFDFISRTYDLAVLSGRNNAVRVLTVVEPILMYLAVKKVIEGEVIDEFTTSKINLQPSWAKYFSNAYQRELAEISKITIYGKVTLLEFLSDNLRRMSAYVRNEELVLELKKFMAQMNPLSPYSILLKKRLVKLQRFAELKEKAITVICRLISLENNAIYSIAEYIAEYLSTQDMEYLQFVWFE